MKSTKEQQIEQLEKHSGNYRTGNIIAETTEITHVAIRKTITQ